MENIVFLAAIFFLAALLYSSVGHGGASAYLTVMALFGMAPLEMKPVALTLNILVASIATTKYLKAGCFSWHIFWPFALCSIPFAYLGGLILLPSIYYKPIIGIVLIYGAFRLSITAQKSDYTIKKSVIPVILLMGSAIGFLSGLVGVGGGIFLSPLLIILKWEHPHKVSGIAALFILVNSLAGLLGFWAGGNIPKLPDGTMILAVAVVIGGYIGAEYGSQHLGSSTVKRLLSLVLLLAGIRMIFTA